MATVYCTWCGHANPQDTRFCASCGTAVTQSGVPVGETGATVAALPWRIDAGEPEEEVSAEDVAAVGALRYGTAMLVMRREPDTGGRILLDADVATVGRHSDSDIFLDDITVSRRHAEFRRAAGRFSVADVGSLNGTYLNKDRIDSAPLVDRDEVMIGKFRMVFFEAPETGQQ